MVARLFLARVNSGAVLRFNVWGNAIFGIYYVENVGNKSAVGRVAGFFLEKILLGITHDSGRRKYNKNNYTIVPALLGIEPNIEYMNMPPTHGRYAWHDGLVSLVGNEVVGSAKVGNQINGKSRKKSRVFGWKSVETCGRIDPPLVLDPVTLGL